MELRERIAKWRHVMGVSQQELARTIGVTPAAIYQWESGETSPRTSNLEHMVRVFGITMAQFYGRVPSRKVRR